MGLDMYLHSKRYISKYFDKDDNERAEAIQKLFPELADMTSSISESPVKEVRIEAGYWRKANQVHKWFVDNIQKGVDDCDSYSVEREQLEELKKLCQQVLDFRHLATDKIDEYYFQDIEHTITIIDRCLALPSSWEFEYHSSW
jgi:hypothetical protein